ncbi:MAG: efflux RND transporter periplasmic adaptor subunit [Verrucomicrobia bacterium]|nr:efflux RND transporter periplasmic adaptor subunit [Verrucomicrobiota bacterium]
MILDVKGISRRASKAGLGGMAILVLTSCKPPSAPVSLPPPIVVVQELVPTNVTQTVEFIGQLDSPQNVEVRARVEAFVEKVLFVEGTNVEAGAPLFALDQKPLLARLASAQGARAEARAALTKYEKDVARLRPLAEKRAIPQQDLENAEAAVDVGEANVLSAEARVASAELDLGYCDVRAPVSGLIGAAQVSVGSLVGRGTPTLLATISTLDPIWFYCSISKEQYLRTERKARERGRRVADIPVTLILAEGLTHPDPGRWVFVDRAVDPATDTLRTRMEFPNPRGLLRPGMFARARIRLESGPDRLVVPQRAVVELQGKTFVWVVGADHTTSQREVELGPRIESDWLVERGLKAGERIVAEGVHKVRDGGRVQPKIAAEVARAESVRKGTVSGSSHE